MSIDPASAFPAAPDIGADVPDGPTMGLPVPVAEEDTKEADAEAVTRVGAEALREAGTVIFWLGCKTVMVCGKRLPLETTGMEM